MREIIIARLKSIGADGLWSPDNICGCDRDDLVPCEGDCSGCVPAKRTTATEAGERHEIGDEVYVPMENPCDACQHSDDCLGCREKQ